MDAARECRELVSVAFARRRTGSRTAQEARGRKEDRVQTSFIAARAEQEVTAEDAKESEVSEELNICPSYLSVRRRV